MVEINGVSYLTVDEACALMGVKPATIYAYVSRGTLHSYKQGIKRQRLYREDEIRALMEIQPSGSATTPAPQASEPPTRPAAVEVGSRELPPAEWWIGEV